jgi:hypothetical protein
MPRPPVLYYYNCGTVETFDKKRCTATIAIQASIMTPPAGTTNTTLQTLSYLQNGSIVVVVERMDYDDFSKVYNIIEVA